MKLIKSLLVICCSFLYFSVNAEQLCTLQPEDYSEDSKQSIHAFEDNIEDRISLIYQAEYPHLKAKTKEIRQLKRELRRLERILFRKYVKKSHRHHKFAQVDRSKMYKRKLQFLDFLDQNLQSEEEFNSTEKADFAKNIFTFNRYREAVNERSSLKKLIDKINDEIEPLQQPHFLYTPKINFSMRTNDIYYGDIQMEVFFTPPKNDFLKIPFLNIGFETNRNTVIYTCIYLNAYDPARNAVFIYFLNATKLNILNLMDVVMNFDLIVRNILTYFREPEVIIAPAPITEDPAGSIITPLTKVINTLSILESLQFINNIISKMQIFTVASRLHPTAQLVLDNVDVGIKGLYIHPEGIKVRYAASTLYGLVRMNLITQSQKADFSGFMNVLTIEEEEPGHSD